MSNRGKHCKIGHLSNLTFNRPLGFEVAHFLMDNMTNKPGCALVFDIRAANGRCCAKLQCALRSQVLSPNARLKHAMHLRGKTDGETESPSHSRDISERPKSSSNISHLSSRVTFFTSVFILHLHISGSKAACGEPNSQLQTWGLPGLENENL